MKSENTHNIGDKRPNHWFKKNLLTSFRPHLIFPPLHLTTTFFQNKSKYIKFFFLPLRDRRPRYLPWAMVYSNLIVSQMLFLISEYTLDEWDRGFFLIHCLSGCNLILMEAIINKKTFNNWSSQEKKAIICEEKMRDRQGRSSYFQPMHSAFVQFGL